MEKEVKKGRLIVCIFIVMLLGSSVIVFANSLIEGGIQYLVGQLIQVCISLLLAWLLYKGYNWARKLLGVLTITASVLGLLMLLNAVNISWKVLLMSLYSIALGAAGISLIVSKKVKLFMEYQNEISRQQ